MKTFTEIAVIQTILNFVKTSKTGLIFKEVEMNEAIKSLDPYSTNEILDGCLLINKSDKPLDINWLITIMEAWRASEQAKTTPAGVTIQ